LLQRIPIMRKNIFTCSLRMDGYRAVHEETYMMILLFSVLNDEQRALVERIFHEHRAQEVYLNGITLSGGCSLFPGLGEYISKAMEMGVNISTDPTNDIVKGGMRFLDDRSLLATMLNVESMK